MKATIHTMTPKKVDQSLSYIDINPLHNASLLATTSENHGPNICLLRKRQLQSPRVLQLRDDNETVQRHTRRRITIKSRSPARAISNGLALCAGIWHVRSYVVRYQNLYSPILIGLGLEA